MFKGKTSILLLLAALLLLPASGFSQMPRPKKKVFTLSQAQQYMAAATFNRVVTVDANGSGDFSTIGAALGYVAAQPGRGGFTRYLVLVYPGDGSSTNSVTGYNFSASNLVIPSYTVLQGVASPRTSSGNYSGLPVVALTGTAGTLVSIAEQSAIANIELKLASVTLTGNTVVLNADSSASGAVSFLDNIAVKALSVTEGGYTLDLIKANAANNLIIGSDVNTYRAGSAAGTRNLVNSGGGIILYDGGRHQPGTSQAKLIENTGSGAMKLYNQRIDPGATVTLTKTGAGAIEVYGTAAVYDTSAGAITDPATHASSITFNQGPKDLSGSGSPEGAVTAPVGSTYRRTDGGASTSFYVKESGTGNTGWVAK